MGWYMENIYRGSWTYICFHVHLHMNTLICYIDKNKKRYEGGVTYFEIFYVTSSTEMGHELKLNSLCRLCGVKIPINSKSYP